MIPVKVNYNHFTLYKASSLNHEIIWSKRVYLAFFFFDAANFYNEVTVPACPNSEKWCHLLLLKGVDENWSLFFLHTNHVQWVQTQLLQLILKSWHNPINKMDLQRDRNCSYWKAKKQTTTVSVKMVGTLWGLPCPLNVGVQDLVTKPR